MKNIFLTLAPSFRRAGDQMLERLVPRASASASAGFWQICPCQVDPQRGYVTARKWCEYTSGSSYSCGSCQRTTILC